MPWCVAVGCSNNTFSKNHEKGIRFYNFPKDKTLKRRWIANIKRENINKNPKICHKHFEETDKIKRMAVT